MTERMVGRFGGVEGLATAECAADPAVDCVEDVCTPSQCRAGYYCPANSTSATEIECGHTGVFCPAGSGTPTPVSGGSPARGRAGDARL